MSPDVAGLFGGNLAQYAYHESVMPLDELAAESGISPDDYIPVYYDMWQRRGKLWALPSTPASTALHLIRRFCAKSVGIPENPPKTIEELDKLDKLAAIKSGDKMERMGFLPYRARLGGRLPGGRCLVGNSGMATTSHPHRP
ncbi:MAG: hypothetical protein R2688_10695 [Fimbriimonadaceae bacterium]